MEMLIIVVVGIGLWVASIKSAEKRIADITEEDDNIISLLSYLLKEAYTRIPDTKENKELLEQIELVIDDEEDNSED